MKLVIFSLSFLISFFVIEADELKFSSFIVLPDMVNGKVSIEIIGPSVSKIVNFPQKEFGGMKDIKVTTTFPEKIDRLFFNWKSKDCNKRIGLGPMYLQINGEENKIMYGTDKRYIENGERISLIENLTLQ